MPNIRFQVGDLVEFDFTYFDNIEDRPWILDYTNRYPTPWVITRIENNGEYQYLRFRHDCGACAAERYKLFKKKEKKSSGFKNFQQRIT